MLIRRRYVIAGLLAPKRSLVLAAQILAVTVEAKAANVSCIQATTPVIEGQVRKILSEHLGVDAAKVTPQAEFIKDLGADSLDTCELVMAFEEAFGVEIPEDAAEKMITVQDAVNYLVTQRCGPGGRS